MSCNHCPSSGPRDERLCWLPTIKEDCLACSSIGEPNFLEQSSAMSEVFLAYFLKHSSFNTSNFSNAQEKVWGISWDKGVDALRSHHELNIISEYTISVQTREEPTSGQMRTAIRV